jgi:hypothetical protein
MRRLNSAATNDHSKSEDKLLAVPLRDEAGVLRTEIDTGNHAVMIDFDPRVISDEGVRQVAEKLAPIGHQQYCRTISTPRRTRLGRGGAEAGTESAEKSTASGARERRFSAVS